MQGRNEGGKGGTTPWAPNHYGGTKSLRGASNDCVGFRKVPSTSFSTVRLLPKELKFEHGGAKLASFQGRHLTLLGPWSGSHDCMQFAKRQGVVYIWLFNRFRLWSTSNCFDLLYQTHTGSWFCLSKEWFQFFYCEAREFSLIIWYFFMNPFGFSYVSPF